MLHRGDLHPYEMKRRFEASMIGCYLDIDVGTLYYAVRQLEKEEAIVAVAEERVGRGGMRTIYSITPKGRGEFQEGFFAQFERDGPVSQTLYGALLFFHCVDGERLKQAIRGRLARLDQLIAELVPLRATMLPTLPVGSSHLFLHIERQRQLDREWLESLLDRLEAGET
jgi:DNA-binding PadR family transcriptional regulator